MKNIPHQFSIRVYGCAVKDSHVLVSHEHYQGSYFTKFPGGGVEFGEGLHDALIREWKEEMGLDISIQAHFYTQDFFQSSAFDAAVQIVTVYYLVDILNEKQLEILDHRLQEVRWLPISSENPMTFPVDQLVFEKLKSTFLL
ncbi:NUDIX hydrolase [Bergeyella zoohelcum]|uniref:Nucleoside triphosphate pyrophosphohydrolase n=1 Tax=Bergeyella zoohelcum TaxID=1015 RepID=A0A380ZVQ8_9FLAO|nr:NUDIX domain-containing protein [Bergeyella zoohelcum]EKB59784.1 hypothetical protein HMPREF9700_01290 [Bergeyella zoohelcum CCUG 30536]SUV52846.1 nucleoside triphosphate pyrophosphohydrolase [Bergeyella zoohelcum]